MLTTEQEQAVNFIADNIEDKKLIALEGMAGTGKTSCIKALVEKLSPKQRVCVSATTNKAAQVLRQKELDDAVTVYQAAMAPEFRPPYDKLGAFLEQGRFLKDCKPEYPRQLVNQFTQEALEKALKSVDENGIYSGFRALGIKDFMKYVDGWKPMGTQVGFLIVDEASMLGDRELATIRECFSKIILIGDDFQLPPINSERVFLNVPDRAKLTVIHRQAADSQPLRIAMQARSKKSPDFGAKSAIDPELAQQATPVIVWTNKTRMQVTQGIRQRLGIGGKSPQVGEMLICRNTSDKIAKGQGLINNTLWRVIESDGFVCTLENDQGQVLEEISIYSEELEKGDGIPFRFGYALTCHQAQGSEWDQAMVHVPDYLAYHSMCFRRGTDDAYRWIYTAVTRAKERVIGVTGVVAER